MTKQPKPILHGRDHGCGGADPIPGICDLMALATGNYQEQVLAEPSLIGYWPLDDAGPPALDHSTSGHNLVVMDTSPSWGSPGPFTDDPATSVFFTYTSGFAANTDALMDGGSPSSLYWFGGVTPYTWEILVYPTAFEASHEAGLMTVYNSPDGSLNGMAITLLPGGVVRVRRAGLYWDSPVSISLNEWVHVAMSYDGTTIRLYFDGEEQIAAATTATHAPSGALQVGDFYDGTWRGNLKGRLAQAAIYNIALSASTIAQHANTRIAGGGTSRTGPPGPAGPAGAAGTVAFYEQTSQPTGAPLATIWIDTDG